MYLHMQEKYFYSYICDRPRENRPSSHLGMIVEIPVLKIVITAFAHVRLALLSRIVLIDILNLIFYSLEFVTCLILGHFRSFFEGAHQFWASVLRGWVGGWEAGVGGWGGSWQQLLKKLSREAPR